MLMTFCISEGRIAITSTRGMDYQSCQGEEGRRVLPDSLLQVQLLHHLEDWHWDRRRRLPGARGRLWSG